MRKLLSAAAMLAAVNVTPVHAQTATGTGVGIANSNSASQAVAIGGGNATGGNATGGNVNIAATPATTSTTSTVNGSQTLKNVPIVTSPGLTAAGLETCLGSASVGVGWLGAGFSGGSTYTDEGCQARLDARTLWAFGLHKAALARLCMRRDIYNSLPECARYLPQQPGVVAYNPNGPAPVVMTVTETEQAEIDRIYVRGHPIDLIDGKTNKRRTCYDYSTADHVCKRWAKK